MRDQPSSSSSPSPSSNHRSVLYSYRRCPYAMRARLALAMTGHAFEVREISFRDKPQEMLDVSPKGTVPVLVLADQRVIDESYDIVLYAARHDQKQVTVNPATGQKGLGALDEDANQRGQNLYARLQSDFIGWLNKYKYADRYPDDALLKAEGPLAYRQKCEEFVGELEARLQKTPFLMGNELTIFDILLFPFIRQFWVADRDWFDQEFESPKVKAWMGWFFEHPIFEGIMLKLAPWLETRDQGPDEGANKGADKGAVVMSFT